MHSSSHCSSSAKHLANEKKYKLYPKIKKKEPHKLEAPTDKISWRLINFAAEIH